MKARRGSSMAFVLLAWIVCWGHQLVSVSAFPHYGGGGGNRRMTTDLQRHVEFFDKNKDGVISLTESIQGFIEIGFDAAFATTSATATHAAFGPLTTPPGKLPSLNIHISHIHRAIHGSDSGAYDSKGVFVPDNFEKIFKQHAHKKSDGLTWLEIKELLIANRDLLDPISWAPAEVEWELVYKLGKDEQGFLPKDTLRGVYDGTVFPKAPAEVEWDLIYHLGKDEQGFLPKDTLRGVYDGTVFPKFANGTATTTRSTSSCTTTALPLRSDA